MGKFEITDIQGCTELSNKIKMPYFGLGVFKSKEGDEVIAAVEEALNLGYRHIDTASFYKNEVGVGQAVRNGSVPREEIFVTSKLWNDDVRNKRFRQGFERSLKDLGFDYLDLFLIHWPVKGYFIEAWRTLEELLDEGLVRAIGVSNFLKHHLVELMDATDVVPMVNQLEFHPYLLQLDLMDFCLSNNIQYEGWAPLMRGEVFKVPEIVEIGKKHNKNAAQITLRWNLQRGVVAIPKSVQADRIESNANIFDFELNNEEMELINELDQNRRLGPNPDNFNF